jgi:RNA polymerase sigma factor (sigma-70 family)
MANIPNIKSTNNYFERTDTLIKYYRDVKEYSVITADQEKELFTLLKIGKNNLEEAKKSGDKVLERKYSKEVDKLREFIVNSNLRFVISIARIYASNNNLLDLIDEGNIGLLKAVDSFDVDMGNRFQTHAVYLIRRHINLFRQGDGKLVKKNNESKTFHIISRMTNKFMQDFQREPTSEELKDYINENYPNANIKDSADVLTLKVSSIDEDVDSDSGESSNIGNINTFNTFSASYNDYESESELDHVKVLVDNIMKALSDRDKEIIKMYFGIEQIHNAPVPISEIADRMNLTETRIRQIIEDSQNKMRETYSGKLSSLQ